jgi:basic membrane protein A
MARLRASALVLTLLVLAAACGQAPDQAGQPDAGPGGATGSPTGPATGAPAGADFSACQVTDTGGVDDRSFNQTAWKGIQDAEEQLGITKKLLESSSPSDFEPNLQAFIQQDCDLIVTVGFLLGDATEKAAKANPDQNFAIVDFAYEQDYDNVRGLIFQTDQAAFLAGYLAAGMTESGKVGTFGGLNIPTVTIFMDGFAAGVEYHNQQKGTDVQVLGWNPAKQEGLFTGDFENQDNGRRTTETLLQNGADIVMPVAGPVGLGGAAALQQSGGDASLIWVDTDGCESAPQFCQLFLTSVVKNMDVAVFDTIKETLEGSFPGGVYSGTLENDGVGIAPFHEFEDQVPQALKDELEQIRQGIIDGSIEVGGDGA